VTADERDTGGPDGPQPSRSATLKRRSFIVGGGSLVLFALLQLVPYGWTKTNPPVTSPAPWPSPQAEAIARESCADCHSNETNWPTYSYVAPMSWLVRRDVERGRDHMNFSEWDEDAADAAEDAEEEIVEGRMPPANYRRIHRSAQLTDEEALILVEALEQMAEATDD